MIPCKTCLGSGRHPKWGSRFCPSPECLDCDGTGGWPDPADDIDDGSWSCGWCGRWQEPGTPKAGSRIDLRHIAICPTCDAERGAA